MWPGLKKKLNRLRHIWSKTMERQRNIPPTPYLQWCPLVSTSLCNLQGLLCLKHNASIDESCCWLKSWSAKILWAIKLRSNLTIPLLRPTKAHSFWTVQNSKAVPLLTGFHQTWKPSHWWGSKPRKQQSDKKQHYKCDQLGKLRVEFKEKNSRLQDVDHLSYKRRVLCINVA